MGLESAPCHWHLAKVPQSREEVRGQLSSARAGSGPASPWLRGDSLCLSQALRPGMWPHCSPLLLFPGCSPLGSAPEGLWGRQPGLDGFWASLLEQELGNLLLHAAVPQGEMSLTGLGLSPKPMSSPSLLCVLPLLLSPLHVGHCIICQVVRCSIGAGTVQIWTVLFCLLVLGTICH